MNFLLNPKVILALVVAAIIAFVVLTFQQNASLKDELEKRDEKIAELVLGQDALKDDIKGLDKIAGWKTALANKERELDARTREIPVTLNDTPFSDVNNMTYANEFRDFQLNSQNTSDDSTLSQ